MLLIDGFNWFHLWFFIAYLFHLDRSWVCGDIVDEAPKCSLLQQWIFSTRLSRHFHVTFPHWPEHLGVNFGPTVCFHHKAQVNVCPVIFV